MGSLQDGSLRSRPAVLGIGADEHQSGYDNSQPDPTHVQAAIASLSSRKRVRDDDEDTDSSPPQGVSAITQCATVDIADSFKPRKRFQVEVENTAQAQYHFQHQLAPPHSLSVTRRSAGETGTPIRPCHSQVEPETQDHRSFIVIFPPGSTNRYDMPEEHTWVPYPTLRYVTALMEEEASRRREPTEEELAAYSHAVLNDLWRGSDLWK